MAKRKKFKRTNNDLQNIHIIYDVLSPHNSKICGYFDRKYPFRLEIKYTAMSASYLDLHSAINSDKRLMICIMLNLNDI
jgi:hypothetical protein